MSLFLELHILQNFAPSNLNRDDTGAPKDAIFGGHRRARISSQCLKRSVRKTTEALDLIPAANRGIRTKRLRELLLQRFADRNPDEAAARVEAALMAAGLKIKDDEKKQTEYLVFLGQGEIDAFAALIADNWEQLAVGTEKKSKKDAKAGLPTDLVKRAKSLLDGGKAVDVALFGRMLADLPEANQDAACQVAHAISTHRVEREFDYFTAVDDRSPNEDSGAGMIGQVEFNSATFYRYAALDLKKLVANLQDDHELALLAVESLVVAMAKAIPSGKQNTFAAHNPPEFIGLCLRHGAPISLANAFEKPVWAKHDSALTDQSVLALADRETRLASVYGSDQDQWLILDLTGQWPAEKGERAKNLSELAARARNFAAAATGG